MTATHPLWRPFEPVDDAQVAAAFLPGVRPARRRIDVVPYSDGWPQDYARLAERVRLALGGRVISLEHVGSTSVPGLAAKPVIDVDLVLADPGDEEAYVPALQLAGFRLIVREPEWQQHRCFAGDDPRCNLHVFGPDATEPARHIVFRDWLRAHPDDRRAYVALKQRIAAGGPMTMTAYNSAKAEWIYELYERAFAADPHHPHDPHPRS